MNDSGEWGSGSDFWSVGEGGDGVRGVRCDEVTGVKGGGGEGSAVGEGGRGGGRRIYVGGSGSEERGSDGGGIALENHL